MFCPPDHLTPSTIMEATNKLSCAPCQVAGHSSIIKHADWPELIFKPIATLAEFNFYRDREQAAVPCVASFHGVYRSFRDTMLPVPIPEATACLDALNIHPYATLPRGACDLYIALRDVSAGLTDPVVIDLKLGTRQHDIYATEEKAAIQRTKCATTTSASLGLRYLGSISMHDGVKVAEPKKVGKEMCSAEFESKLRSIIPPEVARALLPRMGRIVDYLSSQQRWAFWGASLLISFGINDAATAGVTLIDFARTMPALLLEAEHAEGEPQELPEGVSTEGVSGFDRGACLGALSLKNLLERIAAQ